MSMARLMGSMTYPVRLDGQNPWGRAGWAYKSGGRVMPGEDAAAGILAAPIWLAGTAAAVFVVAILLAVKRAGGVALITSLFRVGLIAAAVLGAWIYVEQRGSERRALDDRKAALIAGSIAPGSALSCLDELAGETVEAACEKAVFASPEAVASAVKYVTAQLSLLNDGTAYVARGDAAYASELAPLQTSYRARPVRLRRPGFEGTRRLHGGTLRRAGAVPRFDPRARQSARAHLRGAGEEIYRDLECAPSGRGCGRGGRAAGRFAREERPGNDAVITRIQPPQSRPCNSPLTILQPRRGA